MWSFLDLSGWLVIGYPNYVIHVYVSSTILCSVIKCAKYNFIFCSRDKELIRDPQIYWAKK